MKAVPPLRVSLPKYVKLTTKISHHGAGEMTHQLIAWDALAEDLISMLSNDRAASAFCNSCYRRSNVFF